MVMGFELKQPPLVFMRQVILTLEPGSNRLLMLMEAAVAAVLELLRLVRLPPDTLLLLLLLLLLTRGSNL